MTSTRRQSDRRTATATVEARALLEGQWRRRVDEIVQLELNLHDMRAAMAQASGGGSLVDVELLENHLASARRALAAVEEALARVADGSYGECGGCGGEIASERLEVLPEARLCTSCQAATRSLHR